MTMTPLMRQYFDVKKQYPQEIILFQVGDFYEIFGEDAQKTASCLGIVLTKKGVDAQEQPIPLCGFPRHVLDVYLVKLVNHGFRVVICDQIASPDPGKLIERTVSQVITPGTLTDPKLLDEKSSVYIAVITESQKTRALLIFELLTGQLLATVFDASQHKAFEAELCRFAPREVLISEDYVSLAFSYTKTIVSPAQADVCDEWLLRFAPDQRVFVERSPAIMQAVQMLYAYLSKNNKAAVSTIRSLDVYSAQNFLTLDASTQRHLELVKGYKDGSPQTSLFGVLDYAVTSMGSRTLKKWMLRPLLNRSAIEWRLSIINLLVQNIALRNQLSAGLRLIGDIERVVGRIALKRTSHTDYMHLQKALHTVVTLLYGINCPAIEEILSVIHSGKEHIDYLLHRLQQTLNEDTSAVHHVRSGYDQELDRLRTLVSSGSQAILELEDREQKATGIGSLKIRFNNAYGYGIEITKPHLHLVPDRYQRIQTLVNRERFVTHELKDLEYDIRRAQIDSEAIEKSILDALGQDIFQRVGYLRALANCLAELDAYVGLAVVAAQNGYVCPSFVDAQQCIIRGGRHPIVEEKIRAEGRGQFIANDVVLTDQEQLWIITGPNMGGKSTFLRQVALIIIMAQMGSFVPATSAQLGIFDRIFTRIGAADNLAEGKSTFFVEMEETALICAEATAKSLVILDEVGRGTSTYDGLAIAQAVLEYIYYEKQSKCLFATHYHELNLLTEHKPGIVAYHAASKKSEQGIILLHKIERGNAQGSFGISVAKSARLPTSVVQRAQEILKFLLEEQRMSSPTMSLAVDVSSGAEKKRSCCEKLHQLMDTIDVDALSPRQAFDIVCAAKDIIREV